MEQDLGDSIHIFEWRDEDIAKTDDLVIVSRVDEMLSIYTHTFSCFKCFKSLSSRYVRLAKTGVLKGFIIFFTATACPVS